MRLGVLTSLALASLEASFAASTASALTQPNNVVIPTAPGCAGSRPSGLLAAMACVCTQPGVCNIGAPCASQQSCDDGKHGTCESTMWHAFNDNTCIPSNHSGLDPVVEAAVTPETFRPTCALTFTVVTRGTAQFTNVFGWYNVTGQLPSKADLHPMLGCGDGAGKSAVLDITREAAYLGGDIAFFLMTPQAHGASTQCASGDCCPTLARIANGEGYLYYSERKYNPDQNGASSYIHLITLGSHLVPRKFYFAWEDIYGGSDNEFTDLVTSVDGVECSGGGEPCATGKPGACGIGVTHCANGAVGCVGVVPPSAEKCDGVDNDCNGKVDDHATCPTAGDVCQNGTCVHPCGRSEFRCTVGTSCDSASQLCVDPACIGVTCAGDQVCTGGRCVAACDGVACPHGQTCVGNACVDLCGAVACAAGQVCREGTCFAGCAACDGVVCASGTKCDTGSGECRDPSCPQGCPTGTFCKAGACVDGCDGAKCPAGQACAHGQCSGTAGPSGADAGFAPVTDDGGADGGASGANDDSFGPRANTGCACDVVTHASSTAPLSLLALAILAIRRRRST